MPGRDQVGAAYLVAGWLAAYLRLQFEIVREEKSSGFAAALSVYDDSFRQMMMGNFEGWRFYNSVVRDRIRCTFPTSARVVGRTLGWGSE